MDPQACYEEIRAGIVAFEEAARASAQPWELRDILVDVQQGIESLREWIDKGGFLAWASEGRASTWP